MSAVRVTHTPCHQPVDLTDDNRLLVPDSDVEHHCPVTEGRHHVIRWGTHWSIEDALDWHKKQPRYTTQQEAQAEADQRNKNDLARRRPKPTQPALFDNQEATG